MLGPENWVDHFWRAVSILVPAMIAVWQVNRNYRSNLRLQQEQVKRQQALDIYKEFSSAWEAATGKTQQLFGVVVSLRTYVTLRANPVFRDFSPALSHDTSDLIQSANELTTELLRFTSIIEKYEIVFQGFTQMRVNTNEQGIKVHRDVAELLTAFGPLVPADRHNHALNGFIPVATATQLEALNAVVDAWQEGLMDLQAFLHDLRLEAQNHLIGPFYGRKLPPRKPGDPAVRVLTPEKPLKKWWRFGR